MIKEFIRRFKGSFLFYNFFQKKSLQHIEEQYKKKGIKKRYYAPVSNEHFKDIPAETPWLDQKNSKEVLLNNEAFLKLNIATQQALLSWSDKGYAILNNFLQEEEVDKVNSEIERIIQEGKVGWRYANKKIMFAIHHSDYIKQIGISDKLTGILSLLLGKEVRLFQSINFHNGSEQKMHSDSIHMTTFPLGYLIAVWIALEDITLDNGPLAYYPGSHKIPYVMNNDFDHGGSKWFLGKEPYTAYEHKIEEVIGQHDFKKEVFLAKKGDLLIWHANLLHGGEPHLDKSKTRKSMVFHYYAKDVICYHEITQRPALL